MGDDHEKLIRTTVFLEEEVLEAIRKTSVLLAPLADRAIEIMNTNDQGP